MKCNFCKKIVDVKEVERVYGRMITEYGCCSSECYTKIMTGETPIGGYESQNTNPDKNLY